MRLRPPFPAPPVLHPLPGCVAESRVARLQVVACLEPAVAEVQNLGRVLAEFASGERQANPKVALVCLLSAAGSGTDIPAGQRHVPATPLRVGGPLWCHHG